MTGPATGRTLYVVMGSSGEYSDRTEWPVRAFLDERRAADLVVVATAKAKELMAARTSRYQPMGDEENDADPNWRANAYYDEASYYVMPVPLDDAVWCDIAEAIADEVDQGLPPRRGISLDGAKL